MGVYYHYANFTRRERFGVDAVGGGIKLSNLGYTLASRAFHLFLAGSSGRKEDTPRHGLGRWAGDSVAIVGDDLVPDWEQFKAEFTDIEANAILVVFRADGFEEIGAVAQGDTRLFMQLCHLAVTRQVPELEPHLKQTFGGRYLARYKELCQRGQFEPKDLVMPAEP